MTKPTQKPNPLAQALNKVKEEITAPKDKEKSSDKVGKQASREGKKTVIAYIEPLAVNELKMLAIKRDTTQQELLVEAINDLLMKYGQKPLA